MLSKIRKLKGCAVSVEVFFFLKESRKRINTVGTLVGAK
jgi:hypothetical protein